MWGNLSLSPLTIAKPQSGWALIILGNLHMQLEWASRKDVTNGMGVYYLVGLIEPHLAGNFMGIINHCEIPQTPNNLKTSMETNVSKGENFFHKLFCPATCDYLPHTATMRKFFVTWLFSMKKYVTLIEFEFRKGGFRFSPIFYLPVFPTVCLHPQGYSSHRWVKINGKTNPACAERLV